jgi:holo-[acyl-carrier protein] synthase
MKEELAAMARELGTALGDATLVGIGVDLVDLAWAERLLEKHEKRLSRVFTEGELAYCRAKLSPAPHLAARMAAKEAVLKALGTGLASGMSWRDVEIVRGTSGRPGVVLHGKPRRVADEAGVARWELSLTHRGAYAAAIAAAVGQSTSSADL